MSKNIVIVGFGPGTATAVAEKFGHEGFNVAIVGRNAERITTGVAALKAKGVDVIGITADAGDEASIQGALRTARSQMGPIAVLHWNAYGGMDAGDLLEADAGSMHHMFDAAVYGLLAAAKEVVPDLKADGNGAILIQTGAFGEVSPQIDAIATDQHLMGLALSSAAKHKLVGLLARRLKSDGIYVGEVMVYGTIKNTPSGSDDSIDPAAIADKHWELYTSRGETRATIK